MLKVSVLFRKKKNKKQNIKINYLLERFTSNIDIEQRCMYIYMYTIYLHIHILCINNVGKEGMYICMKGMDIFLNLIDTQT